MILKRLYSTLGTGLALIGIIVFVNLIGNKLYTRIDLTGDRRHSVSEVSKEIMGNLKSPLFITCYYGGDLPPYYKKFEEGIANYLNELIPYANGNFDFQFVTPKDDPDLLRRFEKMNIKGFEVSAPTSSSTQKTALVIPWAELRYNGRSMMVNLIQSSIYPRNGVLDFSVELAVQRLEYHLMTVVYNMGREKTNVIGFLSGHGEYPKEAMGELYAELDAFYNMIKVDLRNGKPIGPSNLDLLIVAQPQSALSDREVYELDQYLMRGGKVIFMMDHEKIDWTLGEQMSTLTDLRATNLDELFMKHGLKINYDLVKDLLCGKILPSQTSEYGRSNPPKPWVFFPEVQNLSSHPTTRYLRKLLIRYGASIDTFDIEGVKK
ncbi:MAG: Gldg family protein, partial [Bacteroidota bacterium]